jgi:hypothetical protein
VAYEFTSPQVLQPTPATVTNEVLVVSAKLKSLAALPVAWRGFEGSGRGEKKRGVDTRHLGVDHVSSTGVGYELDIPEKRIVCCKG